MMKACKRRAAYSLPLDGTEWHRPDELEKAAPPLDDNPPSSRLSTQIYHYAYAACVSFVNAVFHSAEEWEHGARKRRWKTFNEERGEL
uniref:Uncharacterized protein n=1 Tax=Trichuris muris TaxID=70415 RepID=A0A5S6QNX4_TRIMR